MTTEQLNMELEQITDLELIDLVDNEISNLCQTGGKSFTMNVPVRAKDSDMILSEILKRFKQLKTKWKT